MSAGATGTGLEGSATPTASSAGAIDQPPPLSGRSKGSASSPGAAGFFNRWTGRGQADNGSAVLTNGNMVAHAGIEDEGQQAGPSDYWRRTPSPPLSPVRTEWRRPTDQPFPIDPWLGSNDISNGNQIGNEGYFSLPKTERLGMDSPAAEADDGAEYCRRLNAIAAGSSHSEQGAEDDNTDPRDGSALGSGFATPRRPADGGSSLIDPRGGGELAFPQQAESDGTPSTPALSVLSGKQTADPSPLRRNPYLHPSVSRLRSHMRTPSNVTDASVVTAPRHAPRMPSHFSQISLARSESLSSVIASPIMDEPVVAVISGPTEPAFIFHPLRQLSSHLFSRSRPERTRSPLRQSASRKGSSLLGLGGGTAPPGDENANVTLGTPTVMDVHGVIAVGTASGWVVVYSFAQDLRCMLGNSTIAAASGAVTCVKISKDSTYVGVGHASGNIYLYDLSNPGKPARSTSALPLKQVLSGRKEGHLQGSRITHIDFIGARHTAIVSGDEDGRAFWWSLGKVVGVESNDVVRMLGNYPQAQPTVDGTDSAKPKTARRATTLFAATALPLDETTTDLDEAQIVALLTPTKLVIVGLRPTAKTLYRRLRQAVGDTAGEAVGTATWRPRDGGSKGTATLAYSWGNALRLLEIIPTRAAESNSTSMLVPAFRDGPRWSSVDTIKAMRWFDDQHILLLTTQQLILLDASKASVVESMPLKTSSLAAPIVGREDHTGDGPGLQHAFAIFRQKPFLLTRQSLQVGALQQWNDKILSRVHAGDLLGAIRLALAYFENKAAGNQHGLPTSTAERKRITGDRVRELMRASLTWAFSEDRMRDDTHYSVDGRGVDLTGLFEGLATVCIEACLGMSDSAFLFEIVYEHFAQAGIQGLFLDVFEPAMLDHRVSNVPPSAVKALIERHEYREELDLAEAVIWNVDPLSLDIDQAVRLCDSHHLYDALIYVYTQALHDYIAPLVKLLAIIRRIQHVRDMRLANGDAVDGDLEDEVEAAEAYKLFGYLDSILCGESFPRGERLPTEEANRARADVYGFIFSGRVAMWPAGPQGELVLASDNANRSYPYLHLLLRFDTEAFLHTMDVAFEDSWLDDSHSPINRQTIVNLMLDVMDTDEFSQYDITFLNIFVARNLSKYQYTKTIFVTPAKQERILLNLVEDPDQSTREDRQLAAEYLLSAYTPRDWSRLMPLLDQAGFFRILRDRYSREGSLGLLIGAYLRDPNEGIEAFAALNDILLDPAARDDTSVNEVIYSHISHLVDLSIAQTAILLDTWKPHLHDTALQHLSGSAHKQLAYLRCIFEPDAEYDEFGPLPPLKKPSANADDAMRHLYVKLLGKVDLEHLLRFLEDRGPEFLDLNFLVQGETGQHPVEVRLWALDKKGDTEQAFDIVSKSVRSGGVALATAAMAKDEGAVHMAFQEIDSVTKMAVRLCQEHTKAGDDIAEDLWYGALRTVIELTYGLSSLTENDMVTDDGADNLLIQTVQDLARQHLRTTIQALIASSSSSRSFPRLFRRLIESSETSFKKGRAYAEFRGVVGGMLESYRTERDVLLMTTHLIDIDVFEVVHELARKQQQGWRAALGRCSNCDETLGENIQEPAASQRREGIIVYATGSIAHKHCPQQSIVTVRDA